MNPDSLSFCLKFRGMTVVFVGINKTVINFALDFFFFCSSTDMALAVPLLVFLDLLNSLDKVE